MLNGWGYTHDCHADEYPYMHDRRADKDSYLHDRNVTDDLCSLIKLCFAFIMVNFSTLIMCFIVIHVENDLLYKSAWIIKKISSPKGNDRSPESNVPRSNLISKNSNSSKL